MFAGLGVGLAAEIWAERLIRKLLYGVQAIDPVVVTIVAMLFLVAAVAASFLPARRAVSIDPVQALRAE